MRKGFILKLIITILGFLLAINSIDIESIKNISISTDRRFFLFFLCALLFNILNVLLSTIRLDIISDKSIKFVTLLKINFIGIFFNLFLPSTVGGDVVRAKYMSDIKLNKSIGTSIILLDRFIGVMALYFFALCTTAYMYLSNSIENDYRILFIMGFFGFLLSGMCIFIILFDKNEKNLQNNQILNKVLFLKLNNFIAHINQTRKVSMWKLCQIFIVSLIFHINSSWIVYLVSQSINLNIELVIFIVVMPVANLLLMIPISINGLGLRDYIYIELYGKFISNPNLILLAPFTYLLFLATGSIGGVIYLLKKKDKEVETIELDDA